jgi:hypothetical protein
VPAHSVKAGEPAMRVFGTFTEELDELVQWLKDCGISGSVRWVEF